MLLGITKMSWKWAPLSDAHFWLGREKWAHQTFFFPVLAEKISNNSDEISTMGSWFDSCELRATKARKDTFATYAKSSCVLRTAWSRPPLEKKTAMQSTFLCWGNFYCIKTSVLESRKLATHGRINFLHQFWTFFAILLDVYTTSTFCWGTFGRRKCPIFADQFLCLCTADDFRPMQETLVDVQYQLSKGEV